MITPDDRNDERAPAVLKLSEVRSTIADLVNRVYYRGERVIIGRAGRELAAVIPMRDLRLLERLIEEEEDRIDVAEADRIVAEEPESIPWKEVRRGLLEGAAVRDRDQAKRATRATTPARARARQTGGRHRRAR